MTTPPELHPSTIEQRRSLALRQLGIGFLLLIIGIVVTSATYSAARSSSGGGHYVLAYGPIAVGAISMIRGLIGLVSL